MNRSDFSKTSDANGYMLLYKSKPIGGAGVMLPRQKPLRWRHARANVRQFAEDAAREIDKLVSGGGQKRFLDVIAEIDKE